MTAFLLAALTFPALVFTVLLGISLGYWTTVILGVLGPESLDGVVDGMLDGAAEGAVALTSPDEDQQAAAGTEALALPGPRRGFLARYELRRVPVTISFSIFSLVGWSLTQFTSLFGASFLDAFVARGIWGTGVMFLAVLVSLRLTSWAIVPIAPFFSGSQSLTNDELIGQIARVQTVRVTRKVGQATVTTTAGSLNITIRADKELGLTKNDRIMLVSYDADQRSFEVTRIDDMLPSELSLDT